MKKLLSFSLGMLIILGGCSLFNTTTLSSQELQTMCSGDAKKDDKGRLAFPVAKKYEAVKYLGQLFTAKQCSDERLAKVPGVGGGMYYLGSTLFLQNDASPELLNTLKEIGYSCVENKASCKQWGLNNPVKASELLKLETFVENFREDDCRQCQ